MAFLAVERFCKKKITKTLPNGYNSNAVSAKPCPFVPNTDLARAWACLCQAGPTIHIFGPRQGLIVTANKLSKLI